MLMLDDWVEGLPVAVTVTAADGTITAMNARSCETFAADGGAALIGKSVFDCHPPAARAESERLYAKPQPNHYTIKKHGQKKIIHQLPWYKNGTFGGVVEISIPIPESLRHFDRDAK
jgi:transcriptional regulator with PAS, ATPase and Fis domain